MAPIGDKGQFKDFCDQNCLKKYEVVHLGKEKEKETDTCAVCNEPKEIECTLTREEGIIKFATRACFSAYKFSNNVDTLECDQCKCDYDIKLTKYIIYYDGVSKRFCGVACQNVFVMQARKIVPCAWCKVKKYNFDMIEKWMNEKEHFIFCSVNCCNNHENATKTGNWTGSAAGTASGGMPVIQSVSSLAGTGDLPSNQPSQPVPTAQMQTQVIREVVKDVMVHRAESKLMKNKGTLTKPFMQTKGVSCRPHPCHKETQTEGPNIPSLFPIVTPMWMPMPMQMYNAPHPVPVPVPIPIPIPVFIPTTRNSARGIMKQIKKIQAKLPADPFEAELLAMAGALTTDKDDYDSDDSLPPPDNNFDQVLNEALNDQPLQQQQMQGQSSVDFEHEIQGGRVVPKALPQPLPESAVSPGPNQMRAPGQQASGRTTPRSSGQKRRYSQSRGKLSTKILDRHSKGGF